MERKEILDYIIDKLNKNNIEAYWEETCSGTSFLCIDGNDVGIDVTSDKVIFYDPNLKKNKLSFDSSKLKELIDSELELIIKRYTL